MFEVNTVPLSYATYTNIISLYVSGPVSSVLWTQKITIGGCSEIRNAKLKLELFTSNKFPAEAHESDLMNSHPQIYYAD